MKHTEFKGKVHAKNMNGRISYKEEKEGTTSRDKGERLKVET